MYPGGGARYTDGARSARYVRLACLVAGVVQLSGGRASNEALPPSQSGGEDTCIRLDRRCWLEVADARHRYGENLRRYHYEWARRGRPGGDFFEWLDGGDCTAPASCPRERLDREVVRFCAPDAVHEYALHCVGGRIYCVAAASTASGCPKPPATQRSISAPASVPPGLVPLTTGPDGWISVLRDGVIYAGRKEAGRFHHSSFFAGMCVDAAGMIVATDGVISRVLPYSGHYRPGDAQLAWLLVYLRDHWGLNLATFAIDVQLVLRVARPAGRKMDSPLLWSAEAALAFLSHKAHARTARLFDTIEHRRGHAGSRERETLIVPTPK